jgi:hypothetical protein
MSRRNALKLARDAGLVDKVDCSDDWFVREDAGIEQVVQFAALIAESELERNLFPVFARFAVRVAAREREACAKVCEEDGLLWGQRYAAAIRARDGV